MGRTAKAAIITAALILCLITLAGCQKADEEAKTLENAPEGSQEPGNQRHQGQAKTPADKPRTEDNPAGARDETETGTKTETGTIQVKETRIERQIKTLDIQDHLALNSGIPQGESQCARKYGGPQILVQGTGDREEVKDVVDCLSNETLLRIFVSTMTARPTDLETDTSSCIRSGMRMMDLREIMGQIQGTDAEIINRAHSAIAGMTLTVSCLSDTEWEAANARLRTDGDMREEAVCVLKAMGGPAGMTKSIEDQGPHMTVKLTFQAHTTCKVAKEAEKAGRLRPLRW